MRLHNNRAYCLAKLGSYQVCRPCSMASIFDLDADMTICSQQAERRSVPVCKARITICSPVLT